MEEGTITNRPFIDITGEKFHRLLVLERVYIRGGRHAYFRCKCDCGNVHIAQGGLLRRGLIKSCGCYRRELLATHWDRRKKP